ncbi:LolA family protein [Amycolatopsis palatopharyngis]|uniref:LolA family protein n=1 Tax=Amycolatopsis palatopharyngis TaxID=187982 RepID=UPI000E2828BC|nr:outer membrane lipoprotein carrier protein LolA [Amycolatopsis palatopharyngis]
MNPKKRAITVAVAGTAAGALGLGLIAMPAGAGDDPQLPAITAEELVESTLRAETPELAGTVEVDNGLGIPSVPGVPALDLDSAKVFSDGEGRSKLMLRQGNSDHTIVQDGATIWSYDSADNAATRMRLAKDGQRPESARQSADPAAIAAEVLGAIRESSTVSVDGTATVAGRAAYELVLTPNPDERTLLREVRVAVDSGTRLPLRLDVMVNGTTEPVLGVGFSEITFGDQPEELFRFTPPPGATVTEKSTGTDPEQRRAAGAAAENTRFVGDGWDTVLVTELPAGVTESEAGETDVRGLLDQIGRPVSGPFGSGHVISTNAVTALVTADGRVAAGAVPEQVLMEALT